MPTEILLVAILRTPAGAVVLIATDLATTELLAQMRTVSGRDRQDVGRKVWEACAVERPVQ